MSAKQRRTGDGVPSSTCSRPARLRCGAVSAWEPADFFNLDVLKAEGQTDFVALAHRFASDGVIGDMDCFYSHWVTPAAEGFQETDLAALRPLVPCLGLAIKCASLARIAGTLVGVYLARDAGQRVLGGRISRGVTDRINTVLWFSDLRGFTRITDTAAPDEIIPLLNDYAEAVITSRQLRGSMARWPHRLLPEDHPLITDETPGEFP